MEEVARPPSGGVPDRCERCGGDGYVNPGLHEKDCPDCCGTGRKLPAFIPEGTRYLVRSGGYWIVTTANYYRGADGNRRAYGGIPIEDIDWSSIPPSPLTGNDGTGGQQAECDEERSQRFSNTTGASTWQGRSAAGHPDRCECQGDESTPHKHYDYFPFACARCRCTAYRPHDAKDPAQQAASAGSDEPEHPRNVAERVVAGFTKSCGEEPVFRALLVSRIADELTDGRATLDKRIEAYESFVVWVTKHVANGEHTRLMAFNRIDELRREIKELG